MHSGSNFLTWPLLRGLREPAIWAAALVYLYFADPARLGVSLCLFKWLGFGGCPGCGLGHAIHSALHGHWQQAEQAHWLGVPATFALLYAVFSTLYRLLTSLFSLPWTRTTC